jgi:hypothetical protein
MAPRYRTLLRDVPSANREGHVHPAGTRVVLLHVLWTDEVQVQIRTPSEGLPAWSEVCKVHPSTIGPYVPVTVSEEKAS